MNIRIAYSLILSLGFYAGTTFGMVSRTSQRLGGAASKGATALGTTSRRIPSTLRLGGTPASRALMTMPLGSLGFTQAPLGSRSMSAFPPDADSLAMRQLLEQAETRFQGNEQEQSNKGTRLTMRGLISDLMLFVSAALAYWIYQESKNVKERVTFVKEHNLLVKRLERIDILANQLDQIKNDFNKNNASSEDQQEFFTKSEAARDTLVAARKFAHAKDNSYYNIEDMAQLVDKAIIQLEDIVNKYNAPQSYSDWAYAKARNVGSGVRTGISGLARSLVQSRQERAQQRAAIAGQPVPELPTQTSSGALSGEGQLKRLEDRLKKSGYVVEDID